MLNKIRIYLNSSSILKRVVQGGGILAAGTIADNVTRFARNMILARLLAPEAFGIMGTVVAILSAFEALTQVGIRQSVIQNKKGADTEFLNVAWLLSMARGLGLYAIVFMSSPLIGSFYGRSDLIGILRVVAITLIINGAISPRLHVLEKNLQFKYWVFIVQGAGITGAIAGILAAFYLLSVWALVLAYVTEAIIKCSLSYIICPIRPTLNIHSNSLHEIFEYSRRMFGLPILLMIFSQADIFVIGKVLDLDALGIYTLAKMLAETPITIFSMIISPLLMPIFAGIQDDRMKLRRMMFFVVEIVTTFCIPLFAFLIIYAKPLITIVYGEKYQVASVPFRILCVYAFFFVISVVIMQMFLALGSPNLQRTASIWRAVIFSMLIYPLTYHYGLIGGSITILISTLLSLALQTKYTFRLIDMGISDIAKISVTGVKLSFIILIPGILILELFDIHAFIAICFGVLCCMAAWIVGGYSLHFLRHNIPWVLNDTDLPNAS
jgi:lipopolysaccharide exporter